MSTLKLSKRIKLLISLRRFHITQLENADVIAANKIAVAIGKLDRKIMKGTRPKRHNVQFVQTSIVFVDKKKVEKRKRRKKRIKKFLRKKNK